MKVQPLIKYSSLLNMKILIMNTHITRSVYRSNIYLGSCDKGD